MGKLAPALTALGLAATLTACGSEAAPAPAPTPSVAASPTPSPTPTASPTLAPPVMPEAANAHTEAGAKAFVIYYWHVVDYSQATLNVDRLKEISQPTCKGCQGGIATIVKIGQDGATITGGAQTLTDVVSAPVKPGSPVVVTFEVRNEAQHIKTPGKDDVLHPAGRSRIQMILVPTAAGWVAGELRPNG